MRKGLTIDEGTALGEIILDQVRSLSTPVWKGLKMGLSNAESTTDFELRAHETTNKFPTCERPPRTSGTPPLRAAAGVWGAFAGEPFTAFALFQRENYCTNPTLGAGALPSGDSLMAPNCAS